MNETGDRGAEAYRQAHAYITDGNPGWPARRRRRMALRYLKLTASPPLTRPEKRAARQAAKQVRGQS